jgi:pimeloyl-ACP methyl ester carboxylesterase
MPFVDTSLLRVGYEDLNPQGRHAVVLVHGWPDSPRTWLQVAPLLVKAGCRRSGGLRPPLSCGKRHHAQGNWPL